MGEGGALLIRDREHVERAEIIREKVLTEANIFAVRWINIAGRSSAPAIYRAS